MTPRILFIGLGNMGQPMALNLCRAGYPVAVHDLDARRAEPLIAGGAKWVDSLRTGVAQADVVMCALPGPPQVEQVLLGPDGVCAHLRAGMTVIDTSTSSVELAKAIDAATRAKAAHYLESPITNAVDGARLGTLSLFVAGEAAVYEASLPILTVLGKKIFHVGTVGNAATVKLLTNLLWFVSAATIGEALMLGAKAGVPLETVWQAIQASAGNSWVVEHDVPSIFAGHYDPSFSLALCVKDLQLVNQIARQQGYELTMGQHALARFEQAVAQYGADAAELHVVKLLEERVGLLLRPPHGQPTDAAEAHGA